ncbi:MAG: hypothetical protein AAF604_01485 [Acidobacteriota bacterium]
MKRYATRAFATVWLVALAILCGRFWGIALDDFFITFRYAQNLSEGHGFVFNPGERVFGTTAPGLGLLLALLHSLTRIPIAGLGTLLSAAALFALAWWLRSETRPAESLVAGTLVVVSPFLWIHNGGEGLVVLALLATAAMTARRWSIGAGAVAGFAVWCRADAGLAVAILGLLLWHRQRRLPQPYGWTAAGVIALGLISARTWFGDFLPVTLEAKRLQAAWQPEIWPSGGLFWPAALRLQESFLGPVAPTLVAVGLAGSFLLLRHGSLAGQVLTLYGYALLVAYPLLHVPHYSWYAIPVYLPILYGLVFLAGALVRRVDAFFDRTLTAKVIAAVAVLLIFGPLFQPLVKRGRNLLLAPHQAPRYELYREVGEWMATHVPAGEATAFVEVGTLAYFSRRPIFDLLGLVSPGVLPAVAAGDMAAAYRTAPSAWILYSESAHSFMEPLRQLPDFDQRFEERAAFGPPAAERRLILYRQTLEDPGG